MKMNISRTTRLVLLAGVALVVGACSSDNDGTAINQAPPAPPAMASFDVMVTNLTNAQPLSPVAIIAHQEGYEFFSVGSPATVGLETLAEGGDNAALLAEASATAEVTATATGVAPIGPGGSETITLQLLDRDRPGLQISVSMMLVNTNDAFAGLNALEVETLAVGSSITIDSIAYDAGTESDTEAALDIPGPAGGGEGFNAARDDDADQVTMHAGVISQDDGYATSDLTEQHRFDNPVARVRITRTN